MRLAIVPHRDRPRSIALANELAAAARERSIDVVASAIDAPALGMDATDLDHNSGVDLIVAIGGDGTVLKAVRVGLRTGAPVYGINAGHLGFLADGEPEDLEDTIDRIAKRAWFTSSRMLIEASINGGDPVVGLNDVVIEKVESQRTVKLSVAVDGEPFITYSADGVVTATPTGSTAYSLSAGGPLVDPEIDAIVTTPVAPHSLFSRSIVFPPTRTLTFEVLEDRSVGVNVDGIVVGSLDPGAVVTVTRSDERITFVSLSGRSYPTTVKRKFSLE
jgi:NAD+ kinase